MCAAEPQQMNTEQILTVLILHLVATVCIKKAFSTYLSV